MKKYKSQKPVWDKLAFERKADDGSKYYRGEKGLYLFLFSGNGDRRVGQVILNRKFLTGLFKPKYISKVRRFLGDLRNERKFLFFDETGKGEITIYSVDKKKVTQELL